MLHPLAEAERAERREAEKQAIQELEAQEAAYEAEVQAENERWERIENGGYTDAELQEIIYADYQEKLQAEPMTDEDIAETDYWDELSMLAEVVEAEAGNQDLTGKRLVVDVVLNRVDSPLFPDTITEVLMQEGQFSTMWNGAFEDAGWHMQEDDYTAVMMEVSGQRLDSEIYFFTAGEYNSCGRPAYIHGDHYFSYLSKSQLEMLETMQ